MTRRYCADRQPSGSGLQSEPRIRSFVPISDGYHGYKIAALGGDTCH